MPERNGGKEKLKLGRSITVFIGPEGSGKTTVAIRLAGQSGKPYVSTRKILEGLRDNDPGPLGEECRVMFNQNTYLAGETLIKILVGHFSKEDFKDGFVLDGGLRTIEETKDFHDMLRKVKRDLPLTVEYLVLSREESLKRLSDRKRYDDTPEAINKRLDKFYFQLEERLAVIKNEEGWRFIEIDAIPSPEKVYKNVTESLKNRV